MLEELRVRDLALIEDVRLEFGPGMTALTGETGAGKTAVVEALTLLLGGRADSTMVRAGAAETLVEGVFVLGGSEVLAKRRVTADGRSRCMLGDEMVTVGAMDSALGSIVDLHGQHAHQALLSPARHADYLDRFAGESVAEPLAAYREAFDAHREAAEELARLSESLGDRERRLEWLRYQIGEIDAVAPRPGEDAEIESRLPALRHAVKLAEAAGLAFGAVRDEAGASDMLGEALTALARARGLDPALDALCDDLTAAGAAVDDAAGRLREYADSLTHDPRELDAAESRLADLTALKRKHGPTLDDVIETRERCAAEAEVLEGGEEGLAAASARVGETVRARSARAEELGRARHDAATRFAEGLEAAARDLAMEGAAFGVDFTPLPEEAWTRDGSERVEFLFSASAGESPRPLAKIASGGEVSRVMLALKGVLGEADDASVLVFDEVDAGIGGATAHAVGRRLARLARGRQVLVVTHLAQVAAYADEQIVVAKEPKEGRTVTTVRKVQDAERVAEIARMLSGGDSASVIAHAEELLAEAREAAAS